MQRLALLSGKHSSYSISLIVFIWELSSLKGRPESRHVFSSIPLFYRALHTISSQRYRLAVRRYILELFDIRLNAEIVKELTAYRSIVMAQPPSPRKKGERPLTMIRTIERSYPDGEVCSL